MITVTFDPSAQTIREMIDAKVQATVTETVKRFDRAVLEAAWDAGIDIRTPFGPEVIAFARMAWKCWMEPSLESLARVIR